MSKNYSNMDTQLCASIVNCIHKQPDIRISVYAINVVIFQNYPLQCMYRLRYKLTTLANKTRIIGIIFSNNLTRPQIISYKLNICDLF